MIEEIMKNSNIDNDESIMERNERCSYYQSFTKDRILNMNEMDFIIYISKLWAMIIWGDKEKKVNSYIEDNGFEKLKKYIAELIYGSENIEKRWNKFKEEIKGFGHAMISELLTYHNPNEYFILNSQSLNALEKLKVKNLPKYNYQFTGKKYVELLNEVAKIKKDNKIDGDYLYIDYIFYEISNNEINEEIPVKSEEIYKSLHDEMVTKIETIGTLLGFESSVKGKKVKAGVGAVLDNVWEFSVGNLGRVKYAFEVQSKGSIDSLILNLQKAKANDVTVQALVAVSDQNQIDKIKKEVKDLKLDIKYWNFEDVNKVYDNLTSAYEIINELKIVPSVSDSEK